MAGAHGSIVGEGLGSAVLPRRAVEVSAGRACWDGAACERAYGLAGRDASRVPWAREGADPTLVRWLNACACEHVRPGGRAIVAGCGLGDDVAELASRGFDAVGLDASEHATAWAGERFGGMPGAFVRGDVRSAPARLARRFDLVVDVDTLQTGGAGDEDRAAIARGLVSLMHPRGAVLVIAGAGRVDEVAAAAWVDRPMTADEVERVVGAAGLERVSVFPEDAARFAMVFRRGG